MALFNLLAAFSFTKDSSIVNLIDEMRKNTSGTFKNLSHTIGFKGAHDFASVQNAYLKYLDKAVFKMATGAFSYDAAVNECVKELAHSGIRTVEYASGKTYQLDTAARMNVRTACHQMSAAISMQNCENTDTDLVEVSAHWGACPDHALWQGKIYSRSGMNKNYPSFAVCHYGAVDGLCGINCRHMFYPFFEGISVPTKWPEEPDPKEYNGKMYTYNQANNKMREMERGVRATKREIEAQKAIGGDCNIIEARKRKQIREYHQFCESMDIRAKDNRLRVVAGSSDYSKTSAYYKSNKLVRSRNRGIIDSRNMANGMRKSPFYILDDSQIKTINSYADELMIPREVLRYNCGTQTGFSDGSKCINIRGDIFPDKNSNNNRDLLSEKSVLAHEYYGHMLNDPSQFRIGDWRDEFRASYDAAIKAPGLLDTERRMLMLDAYDRAKEAGVTVKYNKKAREIVYGY